MTQPLYLHVLMPVIYVLNFISFEGIVQASQVCLPSLPNFTDKFSSGHHEAIDRGVQVLLPSLVIECNGYITSWRAYVKDHKANTIHFQVWRPVSTNMAVQAYTLVNETIATVTGGHGRELIVVDYVPVQSGDIIGIYQGNSHKGVRIKTVHDPNHDMRQYRLPNTPSRGTQISIDDLPHKKHKVPLLNITIVNHSVEVTSSTAASPSVSVVPSLSPNRPSSVSVSTSHPYATNTEDVARIQSPTTNVLAEDCESASDGLAFLIMIILVMTIAILLLVVFVLGTALIVISVKLRQVKELNGAVTHNSRNNKSDTFVGKQVVIIEEGVASSSFSNRLPTALSEGTHSNNNTTQLIPLSGDSNMINNCAMANTGEGRQSHQQQPCSTALPAATIDNPSYLIPREQCSTGDKHQYNTVCSVYKTPSIESRRAQEYENPQATPHVPLSRLADNVLQVGIMQHPKDIYSHPRHGRRARHIQD